MTTIATLADFIRLILIIPTFALAAYADVKERRVSNRVWPPLIVIGVVLIGWDLVWYSTNWPTAQRLFVMRVALSIGIVGGLGLLFWMLGLFGGADAKAFIAIGFLLPTFPSIDILGMTLPIHTNPLGVFSLTVVLNATLGGLVIPLGLTILNTMNGHRHRWIPFVIPSNPCNALNTYGRVASIADGSINPRKGADLDVIRAFINWSEFDGLNDAETPELETVEAFFEETDTPRYGTSNAELIDSISVLIDAENGDGTVWISFGLPFIVLIFTGLLISYTIGSVVYIAFPM